MAPVGVLKCIYFAHARVGGGPDLALKSHFLYTLIKLYNFLFLLNVPSYVRVGEWTTRHFRRS